MPNHGPESAPSPETGLSATWMLTGEIVNDDYEAALIWLGYWAEKDSNHKLSIYINSPGGWLAPALAIVDAIKTAPNPIKTVVTGECYSGAVVIAAAGNPGDRWAYKNADFMIHQLQLGSEGRESFPERERLRPYFLRVNDQFLSLLAEFTGKSLKDIKKNTKLNKFMSAEAARNFGIVDHVAEWTKKAPLGPTEAKPEPHDRAGESEESQPNKDF